MGYIHHGMYKNLHVRMGLDEIINYAPCFGQTHLHCFFQSQMLAAEPGDMPEWPELAGAESYRVAVGSVLVHG